MASNPLHKTLVEFYRAARHLWGRCPRCNDVFRLSDAAISCSPEPPRDWIARLEKRRDALDSKEGDVEQWAAEISRKEIELGQREAEVQRRERDLDSLASARAEAMLKDDHSIKRLLKEAREQATTRSRSALLGHLFERLGPFLQRFDHDPRDVRPLFHPIDYVCFDGLTTQRRVDRITFVEVKSGTSRPSVTQRSIDEAIRCGRVGSEVWQFGERGVPIAQQLMSITNERKQVG